MKRSLAVVAVLAVTALYLLLGHLNYWPGGVHGKPRGFEFARPTLTSGDEPHYFVVISSLLYDHDIRLDADFERLHAGGYEAGLAHRGSDLAGHSFLFDPRTGRHVICIVRCEPADYAKLGGKRDDLYQVPAHPIGYPALMALLALPFRPSLPNLEPLVGVFSIVMSVLGVVLTYACARRSGLSTRHAVFAAGLLAVASPWLVYVRSYFAEPTITVFLLLAFLALRTKRMVLAGVGIGVAMAMKPVFVLFGFAWILDRLLARRLREAIALTASIGACGVVLLAVNFMTIHMPIASGALPITFSKDLGILWDTLFSIYFGVCTFTPWTICAFVWAAATVRRAHVAIPGGLDNEARRQMVLGPLPYFVIVSALAFGPGWCWGPRYCVPLLPFLAMFAADFALSGPRWRKATVGALAFASMTIALPSALQYHWLFARPPLAALTGPTPTAN